MIYAESNPAFVTSSSSSSTFSWFPLKIARNDACVPVDPFTPRNLKSALARSIFLRSISRS
jgi:hypothetical protein